MVISPGDLSKVMPCLADAHKGSSLIYLFDMNFEKSIFTVLKSNNSQ
jgi:hypothetical protein